MNKLRHSLEQFKIAQHLLYWTVLILPVSVVAGCLVALFLWLLDLATDTRWQHLYIIWLLPLAGLLITFVYTKFGKNADSGNNLIIEEIHKPGGGIPFRMTPLVLFSTIVTHLFGGSAGREGTAVQMGGSVAALFSRWYKLKHNDKRILLTCGIAAGFGAVFGTPVAGAVFAMEVLAIGRIKYDALIPCFIASVVAHITCTSFGIHHVRYSIAFKGIEINTISFFYTDLLLLGKVIVAGVAFGLAGYLFAESIRFLKRVAESFVNYKLLIPFLGGILVVVISYGLGTFSYLGLGVTNPTGEVSIVSAFHSGGSTNWSWLWKLLLTAITLGTGFKGGEVTPLFFIGATLGNTLATITNAPVDLFAGLGFIAVFAGATNTPLACTIMGVELFGSENVLYYAAACFTAFYFSGHSGIYGAQRIAVTKFHLTHNSEPTITEHRYHAQKKGDQEG